MIENNIKNQYLNLKKDIPSDVQLIVVSKNNSAEKIKAVYDLGQRCFGENKVQELVEKYESLPKDIEWHLIGHLQTNKVKYIAPFVDTIQSVDSKKILSEINKEALKNNRIIKVFLQVKIADEDSKFGLSKDEAVEVFDEYTTGKFPNVKISGLMGMATFTDDEMQIKSEFQKLKMLYDNFNEKEKLESLSMGMSGDFQLAIESGSNSVRIGSAIFGERS